MMSVRRILKLVCSKRGASAGAYIGAVIGLVVLIYLASAILPTSLQAWYNVTATGGVGAGWSAGTRALWNAVPTFSILGVVVAVIGITVAKAKGVF